MNFHRSQARSGFTLIEVLVAITVTLLMMVALARIFKIIGDSMQEGRAALELNNRLRNVALRIQHDLANATAVIRPPADPAQGLGYFKYYDGPFTDFSAALYETSLPQNSDADDKNDTLLSRFGDTDDLIMFTARADDVWYTGQVPLFVLQGAAPNASNQTPVRIASQYAEIVLFPEPVVTAVGNPDRSPGALIADPNQYQTIPGTDMPAQYRLHYRTLLIRPDLNIAGGVLPGSNVDDILIAKQTTVSVSTMGGAQVSLPSPTCDMSLPHNQCDLSIRRANPYTGPNSGSPVAANSLADLVDPANRFAHVQIPLTNNTMSMPILALSPKIDMPFTLSEPPTRNNPAPPLRYQSAFIHPAFTLFGARAGEDVLASDILAFDIRGYDPGAPILASGGPDGAPGIAGVDDDNDNTSDNASELGWDGSDDAVLTPGDPGYGPAMVSGAPVIGVGAYVDLAWGRKLLVHHSIVPAVAGNLNLWSALSGLEKTTGGFSNELYKSGQVLQWNSNLDIFQPVYDTWTSRYDSDGILQAETGSGRGVVFVTDTTSNGPPLREAWRGSPGNYFVDVGSDGLDNTGTAGIDDTDEQESLPPFAADLRGIKITIRMEDPNTRLVRQMSVGKEFITTQ